MQAAARLSSVVGQGFKMIELLKSLGSTSGTVVFLLMIVYFYQIVAKDSTATKRMVLMK